MPRNRLWTCQSPRVTAFFAVKMGGTAIFSSLKQFCFRAIFSGGILEMDNSRIIRICDCTLCQGEKSPELSFREKIELCRLLDKLDIDLIELKEICQKKIDSLLIRSISQTVRNAKIAVPVTLEENGVETAWSALKDACDPRLQVSAPVSSVQMEYLFHMKPDALTDQIIQAIRECRTHTSDVEFIAMDATRSDGKFLRALIRKAIEAGASTVTLCDTAGSMLPEETASFLSSLFEDIPELHSITVGYSCSDNLNLADACAISAIQCGVREIKASAFRTDSISLKHIVNILNIKQKNFDISIRMGVEKLFTLSAQIENLCRTGLGHSFRTEKTGDNAQGNITVNTHESRESISKAILKMGYELTEEDLEKVWQRFTALSGTKEMITLKELEAIVATEALQVPPAYTDVQYVINTGSGIGAMSHMKLSLHGKPLEGISAGDGAIDAAFNSIEKATGRHFELDDFQIQSVTEGREAMGETLVRLRSEGKIYSGKGISTDIVGAGIMAYINALNKIIYEEEEA